jgi:hypothetical protein
LVNVIGNTVTIIIPLRLRTTLRIYRFTRRRIGTLVHVIGNTVTVIINLTLRAALSIY